MIGDNEDLGPQHAFRTEFGFDEKYMWRTYEWGGGKESMQHILPLVLIKGASLPGARLMIQSFKSN